MYIEILTSKKVNMGCSKYIHYIKLYTNYRYYNTLLYYRYNGSTSSTIIHELEIRIYDMGLHYWVWHQNIKNYFRCIVIDEENIKKYKIGCCIKVINVIL